MEENKPLVTETEYPDSDTDIISGDGTPIIDTSDQNVDTTQEEPNTSKSDAEESTKDNGATDTEENGVEEDTTTEIVTDPANDPATLESALLVSTYTALSKLAEYVPTEYVNNSEPDLDAEHLNNTEQGLLRVTNLLNGAVDVINDLQTTVAQQASAIETLNSKNTKLSGLLNQKIYQKGTYPIPGYEKYNFLYATIRGDQYNGISLLIPKALYETPSSFTLTSTAKHIPPVAEGYSICAQGCIQNGNIIFDYLSTGSWNNAEAVVYGIL